MPTYEYECRKCGRRFEREQSIREPALTRCPECRGELHRLISGGTGFILKENGGQTPSRRSGHGCSLEASGRTCCGREERCEQPACKGGSHR